jgi:hypothetical protein
MTFLVAHAALHRRVDAEHHADGLAERLGAVEHAEHALLNVQAALDEVRQQRRGDRGVLGTGAAREAVGGLGDEHARRALLRCYLDRAPLRRLEARAAVFRVGAEPLVVELARDLPVLPLCHLPAVVELCSLPTKSPGLSSLATASRGTSNGSVWWWK